ncbi:hypothetical protein ACLKA7_004959 [Drosophila subpalustris]
MLPALQLPVLGLELVLGPCPRYLAAYISAGAPLKILAHLATHDSRSILSEVPTTRHRLSPRFSYADLEGPSNKISRYAASCYVDVIQRGKLGQSV